MKLLQAAPVCLITVVFSVSVCCRAEGAIPLASENFTEITKNCAGNYTQIEDFEARHISSDLFPLCNNGSQPFSGELHHGGGYRILNLNIDKPGGTAALLGIIDGASIDVIVQNSTVRGGGPLPLRLRFGRIIALMWCFMMVGLLWVKQRLP